MTTGGDGAGHTGRPAATSNASATTMASSSTDMMPPPQPPQTVNQGFPSMNFVPQATGQFNPAATYQHIQDLAAKRVSTLDYLRKTHEGRVYWFNTLHFARSDISRLPSFLDPRKLGRRAANLLLLGLSLPTVLDLNTSSPTDYLRALNALLIEFETYQQIHPLDGSTQSSSSSGSLSRAGARIPHMFKRSATTGSRSISGGGMGLNGAGGSRRPSGTADIIVGMPVLPNATSDPQDLKAMLAGMSSGGASASSTMSPNDAASASSISGLLASSSSSSTATLAAAPSSTSSVFLSAEGRGLHQDLLPGEEYSHLLTPALPFEPDFFEVFASLCDILIDCYMRITTLVASPQQCVPGLAEIFAKADNRLRKVIISGIIKEFEESTRQSIKNEVAGVARVVLGGLM